MRATLLHARNGETVTTRRINRFTKTSSGQQHENGVVTICFDCAWVGRERAAVKAAKAAKFNYRLEQILSSHGGAAAVVGSYSERRRSGVTKQQNDTDDYNIPTTDESRTGDGVRTAVRSWGSHNGGGSSSTLEPEAEQQLGRRRAARGTAGSKGTLHWSGKEEPVAGVQLERLPRENVQRLAGALQFHSAIPQCNSTHSLMI